MESVKRIHTRFPEIKKKVVKQNDPTVEVTTKEAVFIQLIKFFEKPHDYQFSLNFVYENLEGEDLLFALECIIVFFQKDTDLTRNVQQNFYEHTLSNETLVGQKGFATIVEESIKGAKFSPSMVHIYLKRGYKDFPEPDLYIEGRPYWKKSSVMSFVKVRKKELRKKNK